MIDADADIRKRIADQIAIFGIKAVMAGTVDEARARISFQIFDVIITDINLPRANGIPYLSALTSRQKDHKTGKAVPVVLLSDKPLPHDSLEQFGRLFGIELVLTRPKWQEKDLATFIKSKVLGEVQQPQQTYDAQVINVFLQAVMKTIEANTKIKPTPGKAFAKPEAKTLGEFTGIINMTGKAMKGTVAISAERIACKELALELFQNQEIEINNTLLADVIGEFANQIAGNSRSLFLKINKNLAISTPTVISGIGHTIEFKAKAPALVLPFIWKGKNIFVTFMMLTIPGVVDDVKPDEKILDQGDITFL